jgi:putative phosphoribosyl transferase
MPFRDRVDAGRQLAARVRSFAGPDLVVLGIPRGGVPVAAEVARALGAPLDVVVVRKLGVPMQPELAMGAIGEGDVRVLNDEVLRLARISATELAQVEARERDELARRARRFRGERPPTPLAGRTAMIVDDGIATGSTASAACRVLRAQGAARVVLAVPVAAPTVADALAAVADEVVCLELPVHLRSVGEWYADFSQTSDEEVVRLLAEASPAAPAGDGDANGVDQEIDVPAAPGLRLPGHLTVPPGASGLVVFAHGSGSSRHSPRNQLVAQHLVQAGLGTLLFDLLTAGEEHDRGNVFDIERLGSRLAATTTWLHEQPEVAGLPVGCFGASTGAAAALWAAAEPGTGIDAVVSRGGRPDLAGTRLATVRAPTLLIVGGHDEQVLELNQRAAAQLTCEHQLAVVPGATHLFEEPGTLHAAADLARDWFLGHLGGTSGPGRGAGRSPR